VRVGVGVFEGVYEGVAEAGIVGVGSAVAVGADASVGVDDATTCNTTVSGVRARLAHPLMINVAKNKKPNMLMFFTAMSES